MKTEKEFIKDFKFDFAVVEHIKLHNNSVLIVSETRVSDVELRPLVNATNLSQSPALQRMANSPKIIVGISKKILEERPDIKLLQMMVPSNFDNPIPLNNPEDILDYAQVIEDFKFDDANKGSDKFHNAAGNHRLIRSYYICDATLIPATIEYK